MSLCNLIKPIICVIFLFAIPGDYSFGQKSDYLNTTADASYMKSSEVEMINEINLLRSNPEGYLVYLDRYLEEAKSQPEMIGIGQKNYTLTVNYEITDGVEKIVSIDTTWLNGPEDESKAIENLRKDLSSTEPLSILKPDKGIYEAAKKHAFDQGRHNWSLGHIGSDGSMPWDRILKYSPDMADGNENLAARYPKPTVRQIVIQLLIDTGIPGYGHRYNLLNPDWTHVGCYDAGFAEGMYRWIQDFGQKK